uniref:Uncharacterized protein n=1 Tax=Arundo donax TaxID=35708 RepID=A0A0A9G207_ARUDO
MSKILTLHLYYDILESLQLDLFKFEQGFKNKYLDWSDENNITIFVMKSIIIVI